MKRGELKRTKGLTRSKPLEGRAQPLERREGLARGNGPARTSPPQNANTGLTTAKRRGKPPARWTKARGKACEVCGSRPGAVGRLDGHHVVYAQHVEGYGGDVWDPRNCMTVCRFHHDSHHGRSLVIPTALLPAPALAFAVDLLGPGAAYEYVRRRYYGIDPRLDALVAEV